MPATKKGAPERIILVHFGELWLRGKNRPFYITLLTRTLKERLRGCSCTIEKQYDRLMLRLGPESELERITSVLDKVFGISNYKISYSTKPTMGAIKSLSMKLLKASKAKNVKIEAHRTDKHLKFDSNRIIKDVCAALLKNGMEPELHGYDTMLYVNVTTEQAFISIDKRKGLGGLPVGSGGKCVILLSGGIDSPVAAWCAMKRGMWPVYVHVHAFANADEIEKSKMVPLLEKLSAYSPHYRIYYVPSHIFDAASVSIGAGRESLTLLKHFMLKLAEQVAKKEGARIIFTGESLGQVASQTPENLAAEEYGTKLPILRPLAGMDKEEIVKTAKDIGTFGDSVAKYRDVCSISSKNPRLKARMGEIALLQKHMKLGGIVSRSLKSAKIVTE